MSAGTAVPGQLGQGCCLLPTRAASAQACPEPAGALLSPAPVPCRHPAYRAFATHVLPGHGRTRMVGGMGLILTMCAVPCTRVLPINQPRRMTLSSWPMGTVFAGFEPTSAAGVIGRPSGGLTVMMGRLRTTRIANSPRAVRNLRFPCSWRWQLRSWGDGWCCSPLRPMLTSSPGGATRFNFPLCSSWTLPWAPSDASQGAPLHPHLERS